MERQSKYINQRRQGLDSERKLGELGAVLSGDLVRETFFSSDICLLRRLLVKAENLRRSNIFHTLEGSYCLHFLLPTFVSKEPSGSLLSRPKTTHFMHLNFLTLSTFQSFHISPFCTFSIKFLQLQLGTATGSNNSAEVRFEHCLIAGSLLDSIQGKLMVLNLN